MCDKLNELKAVTLSVGGLQTVEPHVISLLEYVTGIGVLALNQDANSHREVIRGHSFRVKPNDPNVAPPFIEVLEGETQISSITTREIYPH